MNKLCVVPIVPIALASVLLVSGCDTRPQTEQVAVEEDIVIHDRADGTEWIVEEIEPIPAPRPATIAGPRPSNTHIWIPGEWQREDGDWKWQLGGWRRPPFRNAGWMSGHWRFEGDKWHWTAGHWVVAHHPRYVTELLVAPAPLPETMPEKPSEHDHWIAGYWDWDGYWYWIPGYWTSKPEPNAEWVAGHWDEFGMEGGYRWIGGHWRLKNEAKALAGRRITNS
jgi:hypothetical protein